MITVAWFWFGALFGLVVGVVLGLRRSRHIRRAVYEFVIAGDARPSREVVEDVTGVHVRVD